MSRAPEADRPQDISRRRRTLATTITIAPGLRERVDRKVDVALFLTLLLAYGYFHQGGGWNQNVRFDQVRAIVETGHLYINDYVAYRVSRTADGRAQVTRTPMSGNSLESDASFNTRDYSIDPILRRYYPNKPPGTTI